MLASLSDSLHLNVWFPQTIARAGCPPCISARVPTFVCQVFLRVDELLKQRDAIHSSFTTVRTMINSSGVTGSSSKIPNEDNRLDGPAEDGSFDGKDKSNKKKWFNLNLNRSDKKG
ncbi:hypothetical protein BHE74_00012067 [Ensete ventricosum]|nr:hypothetical protein BHE74_00012067 [Ensete ventricosum]